MYVSYFHHATWCYKISCDICATPFRLDYKFCSLLDTLVALGLFDFRSGYEVQLETTAPDYDCLHLINYY